MVFLIVLVAAILLLQPVGYYYYLQTHRSDILLSLQLLILKKYVCSYSCIYVGLSLCLYCMYACIISDLIYPIPHTSQTMHIHIFKFMCMCCSGGKVLQLHFLLRLRECTTATYIANYAFYNCNGGIQLKNVIIST